MPKFCVQPERDVLFDCVGEFAHQMKLRLLKQLRAGRSGWTDPAWANGADLERRLLKNLKEKDMVDVANLAMFRWNAQ